MKKFLIILMTAVISLSTIACGNNGEQPEETILQIAQNDYAGGYQRLTILQQDVLEKMKILEEHNYTIMSGNPTDYWAEDNFYFTDFLPVYNEQLAFTSVLNEIDDFSAIESYIASQLSTSGYESEVILKKEPHNYKVRYYGQFINPVTWQKEGGSLEFDCLYDPAANRMKVSSNTYFNRYTISDFYEFAELTKGKYAIQNGKERLYAEYDDAGKIKSFYYSSLSDINSIDISSNIDNDVFYNLRNNYGFDGYVLEVHNIEQIIPNMKYLYVTYFSNGDAIYFTYDESINRYQYLSEFDDTLIRKASATGSYDSNTDSIYSNISSISSDWVYDAGYFNQTVKYENNALTIMNTNVLTGEQETFSVQEIIPSPAPIEVTTEIENEK